MKEANETATSADVDFWDSIREVYDRLKSPLRPDASEIAVLRQWVDEEIAKRARHDSPEIDVLVLGVTPEITEAPWPKNVRLTAVDKSECMIRACWPGDVPGRRRAVKADWDDMPFAPATFQFVVGDGIFNMRRYPDGYADIANRIRTLLKPDGLAIMRVFLQLDPKEQPADVIAGFRAGAIADYDEFRFRFFTSLQTNVSEGILSGTEIIDEALAARGVPLSEVLERTGYERPPARRKLLGRRPPPVFVSFPSLDELRTVLSQGLRIVEFRYGSQNLSSRCPILGLRGCPPEAVARRQSTGPA